MTALIPWHSARFLVCSAAMLCTASLAAPQSSAPSPAGNKSEAVFKAETDLVLVSVVVRDAHGNAVGNLHKEDFQIFDQGKPQEIAKFAVEETSAQVAADRSVPAGNAGHAEAAPAAIPDHFVALLFDDLHMKIDDLHGNDAGYVGDYGDLVYVRDAALKLLDTLRPADRVAIFTTSGQVMLDFTFDRAKQKEALSRLGLDVDQIAARRCSRQSRDRISRTLPSRTKRGRSLPSAKTSSGVWPGCPASGP